MKYLIIVIAALISTASAAQDNNGVSYQLVHVNGSEVLVADTTLSNPDALSVEDFISLHGLDPATAEVFYLDEMEGLQTRSIAENLWMMSPGDGEIVEVRMDQPQVHKIFLSKEDGENGEPVIIREEIMGADGELEIIEEVNPTQFIKVEKGSCEEGGQQQIRVVVIEDEEGEFAEGDDVIFEQIEMNVQVETTIDEDGNEVTLVWINGEEVDPSALDTLAMPPMPELTEGGEQVFVYEIETEFEGGNFSILPEHTIVLVSGVNNPEARAAEEIEAPQVISELNFMPNPNNGTFTLSFELADKAKTTVEIRDMNGRLVYEEALGRFSGEYRNTIDISDAGPGAYLLVVTHGKDRVVERMIVQ